MVFWVMPVCSLVGDWQHFRETYYLPEDGGEWFL
jgi:hypothetical protein